MSAAVCDVEQRQSVNAMADLAVEIEDELRPKYGKYQWECTERERKAAQEDEKARREALLRRAEMLLRDAAALLKVARC